MEQATRHFLRTMSQWLITLLLVMSTSLAVKAAEAYACYTSSNTTLTFYYDNQRASRTGTTYDLPDGDYPAWIEDGTYGSVTRVVFNSSFAQATPSTTRFWFYYMYNLVSITGMDQYLNTSHVTDMSFMFCLCRNLTSLDVSGFNTANVTSMSAMFSNCESLTSLDVSGFNTSKVTNMSYMFNSCTGLTSLDVSNFNTSKVTIMNGMFVYNPGLTTLDLRNFNTSQATGMATLFQNCSNLRTIYVSSGWNTSAVTNSADMFKDCTSLVGGKGTTYNDSNPKDKTYAHIDGGPSNPGYLTGPPEAYACYTPGNTTLTFYYDYQRSRRSGTTYDLNTGYHYPGWYMDDTFENVTRVVFDPSFAGARPTTTCSWFTYMTRLTSITGMKEYLNTSEVTNMRAMFYYCSGLTSLDVSGFNTANVTDMSYMFSECWSLTSLDVSGFNTANVTDMSYMFAHCFALTSLDLSNFNTANVTDMSYMFFDSSYLTTIYAGNEWSTAAVTSSSYMFLACSRLVGGQGTTYDDNHTSKTYAHIDGGPSNPGYFTEKNPEAYACYTPSNTTLTFYCDYQRSSRSGTTYDLNEGGTDTGWDTDGTKSSVTKVVFDPSFAGARPTTTYDWFYQMSNLQSITGLNYLNTSEVTNMGYMFYNCTQLTSLDLSHFNTSKVTYMRSMFNRCSGLTNLDVSGFNTSNVTTMYYMFYECSALTKLDVSGFNTAKVTTMSGMFNSCNCLPSLDVSGFNTAKVTDMSYMFAGCRALTSLDVSSFNTSNVTNMVGMFYYCYNLATIYVGNEWSTVAVTNSTNMFYNCTSLVGGQGTTYNASHVDKEYAHIDGGAYYPGYFSRLIRGDVNHDGLVNVADVTALIQIILNSMPVDHSVADLTGDGNVNVADVTTLIQMILNN